MIRGLRLRVALGVFAALFTSTSAFAAPSQDVVADALSLNPSGGWRIDYADDSCTASRPFGENDALVVFNIKQRMSYINRYITLAGPGLPKLSSRATKMEVQYGNPSKIAAIKARYTSLADEEFGELLIFDDDDLLILQEDEKQDFVLQKDDKIIANLALGKMEPVKNAMDACVTDLLKTIGANVEILRSLGRHPLPRNPFAWISAADYPSKALRDKLTGKNTYELTVDDKGKVTECRILKTSGHEELDEATCETVSKRARFKPGLDQNMQPATSVWISSMNWSLPQ